MRATFKNTWLTTFACVMATALMATTAWAGHKGHASGTHTFDAGMIPILKQYMKVQTVLASDANTGVQAAAKSIAAHAGKLDATTVTGEHAEHYKKLPMKIKAAALAMSKATSIETARNAFRELSKPMAMWGTMSKPKGVDVLFCSMAKASWLQKTGAVKNPYYGASMLACGQVVGGAAHAAGSSHGHSHH